MLYSKAGERVKFLAYSGDKETIQCVKHLKENENMTNFFIYSIPNGIFMKAALTTCCVLKISNPTLTYVHRPIADKEEGVIGFSNIQLLDC